MTVFMSVFLLDCLCVCLLCRSCGSVSVLKCIERVTEDLSTVFDSECTDLQKQLNIVSTGRLQTILVMYVYM